MLLVNNTGNVEDAYTASIIGTTGSISASLADLTGAPTQTIPIFRLPGLSTGAILLTADLNSIGQGTVTVAVQSLSDGTIVADATATLVVNTQPPTTNPQSLTTAENVPLGITLTGADRNTPALPLTYTVISSPSHGTLSGTAPDLVFTPSAGYFGPDGFAFNTINGYLDSALATVSIDVIAPPTANNSSFNVAEDTAEGISLTATDPNMPALPLAYVIMSAPAHGTLSAINGDTVTYTPDANYFGADSFQFKVNNGTSGSNIATVSLNVLQATVSAVSVDWDRGQRRSKLPATTFVCSPPGETLIFPG